MIAGRYPGERKLFFGFLPFFSVFVFITCVSAVSAQTTPQIETVSTKDSASAKDAPCSFAVVELFTSESCPSCPAADKLLSDMGSDARKKGLCILPLAFHVDYWNTGSAADPVSNPAFAQRQKAYVAAFDSDDVYTPQMIVNGKIGFVGNERSTAEKHVKAALARPAVATVKLTLEQSGKSRSAILAHCDVRAGGENAKLQVAVIESDLSVKHNGKTRKLDNVVRVFKTIVLTGGGPATVELQLPRDLTRKNASVVAYVQDGRSLAILGAACADLDGIAGQRVADSSDDSQPDLSKN